MQHPPLSLTTPRLVLRCWKPSDAAMLKSALDSSLEHLRPWMPWAHDEPSPLETLQARLTKFRDAFEAGHDYIYGIFNRDETEVLGGTGLHPRNGENDREIGYWLRTSAIGQGFATESSAALTIAGFTTWPLETMTIICDPANSKSSAVPARLGYELIGNIPSKISRPGRELDQIWRMARCVWNNGN